MHLYQPTLSTFLWEETRVPGKGGALTDSRSVHTSVMSHMFVDEAKKVFVVNVYVKEYINPSVLCKWFNIQLPFYRHMQHNLLKLYSSIIVFTNALLSY